MKQIFKIALSLLVIASVVFSCQKDAPFTQNDNKSEIGVYGDQIKMRLNVVATDPINVNTKAVNPDGKGVQSMVFFCFDAQGKFLAVADGMIHPNISDNEKGQVDVAIPHNTRSIHVICNLNMTQFAKDAFKGKFETEVIQGLEAISGLLIYWAKIEIPADVERLYTNVTDADKRTAAEAILDWITIQTNPKTVSHKGVAGEDNPIQLLRNQARITVHADGANDNNGWEGTNFVVTGYAVYNSNSYGTVAPYHPEYGYPSFGSATFGVTQWSMDNYISVPEEDDYLDDVAEVLTAPETFIFESPNVAERPVEVIIKGYNIFNGVADNRELYYKAQIIDFEKGLLPIRRNHYYKFEIVGNLYNGQETFADAVKAPAANNIWVTVADEVKSIQDGSFKLSVDNYLVVRRHDQVQSDNNLTLGFNVTKLGSVDINADLLQVNWLDENQNVADNNFNVNFDPATGKGSVDLKLHTSTGDQVLEGIITVQYRQLFRRIKVKVVPQFEFLPVYASSEGIQGQRDHVTLVYNVPDNYPVEMFPFNVLISTNDLDVRASSGQRLTIVTDNEEGYGDSFEDVVGDVTVSDNGYKYIMQVTKPGKQRLYLETIENQVLSDVTFYVTLENENFKRHHEPIVFSNDEFEAFISVKNMNEYQAEGVNGQKIYYKLVPQKRYAPVVFDLATEIDHLPMGPDEPEVMPVPITTAEEFLLYSLNLDHYPDDDQRLSDDYKSQFDCNFVPFNESEWSSNGRVFGFSPRKNISDGKFEVYMETNKPKSDEVIFIVSNNNASQSILGGGNYAGNQFRSATFELANYRPYRFAAQLNGIGSYVSDASESAEQVSDIALSYLDKDVALSFDITSFTAADGSSVDPFGTAFEVYIDAPMLTLGSNPSIENEMVDMFSKDASGNHIVESKKKLEDLGDGRFVYRVDANREKEASFWSENSLISDSKVASQTGERKIINFVTKGLLSEGTVTISANAEQISYFAKSFRIANIPVQGNITFGENKTPLPVGYSISFYNIATGDRIYSTVSKETGKYDFHLNSNRPINPENDGIRAFVQIGGKFYTADIQNLNSMFDNSDINLVLQ